MADRSNHLYYGDNLTILRERIPDESVDLIYLDPPFNSNATYNVLFKSHDGTDAAAQIQAFDDTWHWNQQTEKLWLAMIGGGCPPRVADALTAMRNLLGTSDMNAYLVMMTARLVELHRVLKPTGSIYLHCDPTASHYLKIVLDAVFGPENFRNEIVWHYYNKFQGNINRFASDHDTIFWYSKGATFTFNRVKEKRPEGTVRQLVRVWDKDKQSIINAKGPDGKVMYQETDEKTADDVWRMPMLQPASSEKLGYPTQKPVALLERIIAASSNEGDVVLDPFCGCGTTVDAAHKRHRKWIGIDVTYLAIDLIRKRLRHAYGDDIEQTYQVHGVPADLDGARALFEENPFDFERWAVSLIDAQPNEKQVGDKGIDGRVRFYAGKDRIGQALVSVKGGKSVAPSMVNEIAGTVSREQAELGILITLTEPTKGMRDTADKSGTYTAPLTGQEYPKVQIVTVADLMAGRRPSMPTAILPYMKAKPRDPDQLTLGG